LLSDEAFRRYRKGVEAEAIVARARTILDEATSADWRYKLREALYPKLSVVRPRVFYDFEFLEDGNTIYPIAIGMVNQRGEAYYAVNGDIGRTWKGRKIRRRIRKHKFLMENVVPHLPHGYGDRRNQIPQSWLFDYTDRAVKSLDKIADEVLDFLRASGEDLELWAYYGAYDYVALCQLWGPMADLPEGVPRFTRDLKQELERLGLSSAQMPTQKGTAHNALADARWNRDVADIILR